MHSRLPCGRLVPGAQQGYELVWTQYTGTGEVQILANAKQAGAVTALPGIAQANVGAGGRENSGADIIPPKRIGLPALIGLVTSVQALATFTVLALPTLATKAAPALGVGPEAAGCQISIIYLAAACISGMAGLFTRRYGAALARIMHQV